MIDESLSSPPKPDFTRRGFVMTSLAAGFALSAQPVSAQTITTDTRASAGEVKIPVSDGEIPAYRAMPDKGGPFPVILVVQEIFGVHEHIKDICRRLAKLGYLAVAPELYARQGDVSKITDIPGDHLQSGLQGPRQAGDVRPRRNGGLGQGDRQGRRGQARHHRLLLGRADRLAVLGTQPQFEGRRRLVRPAGQRPDRAPARSTRSTSSATINAPILGLYGEADQGIPVASVEKMRAALKEAGKTAEIILYPDTPHAFFADYRPSYRKDKAEDGWKRMLEWFKKKWRGVTEFQPFGISDQAAWPWQSRPRLSSVCHCSV